jgi:probable phosphoglycerate mutase
MKPLAMQATRLARNFASIEYAWMPRERNKHADRLANEAMDDAAAGRTWRGSREGVLGSRAAVAAPASEAAPSLFDTDVDVPIPEPLPPAPNRFAGFMPVESVPTTFVAVRHGVTPYTIAKRYCGSSDVPLNEAGVAQAEAAAQRLAARAGITAVVCSPLRRARSTAELIAAAVGAAVTVDDGLRECEFGAWEGLTFGEVQERFPDDVAAWLADPTVAPPGGESFADVWLRVRQARDRIVASHPGATVAVVSHSTPITLLACLALEAPLASLYRLQIAPASVTEIDWYADGPAVLRTMNATEHLPG